MSEKKKYRIKINRKRLSKEEIEKRQNIGKVLRHHRLMTKRPVYRRKRFYFILFLILLLLYLIFLSDK